MANRESVGSTQDARQMRSMYAGGVMGSKRRNKKLNVTVRLDPQTIQKVKIIAAKRSTSISALLAQQIGSLVGEEVEAYARAERQALTLLDQGFHLGGGIRAGRDDLHER